VKPDETGRTYGVWVKATDDGEEIRRTAHSSAEAVQFRFDGWQKVEPLPPPKTTIKVIKHP